MKNIKKNPVLYGVVNTLGTLILTVVLFWIICLIIKKPFSETLLKGKTLIIIVAACIIAGVQAYLRLKNKDKKEL